MGLFSRKKDVPVEDPEIIDDPPGSGPWDEADLPERDGLIDAGALLLPVPPEASIQFSVDKARSIVLGVVYIKAQSAVQLQAFAAPKSSGIWEDVRADLISSIASQGGKFTEVEGNYGKEVYARMPVSGNEKAVTPVRYIGIDGPRWLLRVTVSGRAALDENLADTLLHEILDDLVVVRGQVPHPPREILELRIPKKSESHAPERPTLQLPQRGPEISEVR